MHLMITLCDCGTRVIFSGLRPQPLEILTQMGIRPDTAHLEFANDFEEAVKLAKRALAPGANR